jgi:hypothetical protein
MPPITESYKWSDKMNKKINPLRFYRKFILKGKPKYLPQIIYYWFIKNCLEEI